ncbi:MAG: hypothetical protein WDN08_14245 [Rhizomicrobium sp.]
MHAFAQYVTGTVAPLKHLAAWLAGLFVDFACTPLGAFAVAAVVVTSLAVAIGCGTWAIGERVRSARHRERMLTTLRRQQIALHFRDALIGSLPEAVVVLRGNPRTPLCFGEGGTLLRHCLAGPDATKLAVALNDLLARGAAFTLAVRTISIRPMVVRGQRVGDSVAIFIQENRALAMRPSPGATAPTQIPRQHAVGDGMLAIVGAAVPAPRDETAVIDTPAAGTIVVGPDGRLKQYDAAFARQWLLRDEELGTEPHLSAIAERCAIAMGRDGIWDIVASGAASAEPERYNGWGTLRRGDGQVVSLSLSRLANGATQVIFAEVPPASPPRLPALQALAIAA